MPQAAIPWLVGAAVGAQGVGAVVGHRAAGKASKVQKDAEDQALALQRQMYQESTARYQPFIDQGQAVLPTLRSLAGNVQAPRYGQNLAQLSVYGSQSPMRSVGASQTPAVPAQGGLVQMESPDGEVQAVRRELVPHYVKLGGKVVG